ncbi:MAG: biopolymer transporter ExbD [Dysgonamonadaceae bacterium]|jgi:biopolymer transport protein ExbD|nr:biopolymer transporter ExbD [Dysgonamonadaceae bacterium]
MSKFRKSTSREVPALNTASLPDLIFTILFFFMIVTNMRSVPVKIQFEVPTATELQKLKEKSLLVYVMIGKPHEKAMKNTDILIQLNSDFVSLEEIPERLQALTKKVPTEDQEKMIAVLKIDKNTPMGLVNDVKKKLREAGILTIHYSVEKNTKRNL